MISSNSHFNVVNKIGNALLADPTFHAHLNYYLVNQIPRSLYRTHFNQDCLIVTIGVEAFEFILTNPMIQTPVLCLLTREYMFKDLMKRYNRSLEDLKRPLAVIYLDQPLKRQLDLIHVLFQDRDHPHLGVILSQNSPLNTEKLQHLIEERHVDSEIVYIEDYKHPVALFNQLLQQVDVILATPDPKIYHAGSVRGMLMTAFHHRVPIIGYSHTFVNNGAMASVYSNSRHISEQAAKTILAIYRSSIHAVPKEQYPNDFSIAINHQVAQSLGFTLHDRQDIKLKMRAM